MKQRRLGKTGWNVSEIGLGCWQLGNSFGNVSDDEAQAILGEARRLGVNFWDTADVYGGGQSEQRVAVALKQAPGTRVATKVGRGDDMFTDGYVKARVREKIQASAKRLGVDTIDLIQTHTIPPKAMEDGEIFTWLEDFQQEGLIRQFGASVETVEEGLVCLQQPKLASLQIIFSLFRQDAEDKLLAAAAEKDVGIIVRLPLASGLLSGKFGKGHRFADSDHRTFNANGEAFNIGETFAGVPFDKGVTFAERMGAMNTTGWPLAHVAIRWLLDHPEVSTVIAGVTRPEQLAQNVAAAERPALPADLTTAYGKLYREEIRPTVRGFI
jgi:aryl-alcohol dehydrogenase-like predicted oxidoreductase